MSLALHVRHVGHPPRSAARGGRCHRLSVRIEEAEEAKAEWFKWADHTTMPNGPRRALLLAFIATIGGGLVGGLFVVV